MLQLIQHAQNHSGRRAIVSGERQHTYDDLLLASETIARVLLDTSSDLNEQRVGFMVNPGFDYVCLQWAIWRAGGVAVPLCLTHPQPALQYVLEDTGASQIVVSSEFAPLLSGYAAERGIRLLVLGETYPVPAIQLPDVAPSRRAMILYTSGTTSKPKGVVTTHANLEAQISILVDAWAWSSNDHTLCVLPLHHVHGIVNVVCCALWSGATCTFVSEFSGERIFSIFRKGEVNVFMAVPTIYHKLIAYWDSLPPAEQQSVAACLSAFRLMVCGSAALPVSVLEKWKEISGHVLLERYGMTEIGMAIGNPYAGERRPGYIGMPLPGVQVRLVDEQLHDVVSGQPGEILVKGAPVFCEYWNRPEATTAAFTGDGWFRTGDIAVMEQGYYRIMGRNSVDIIKSGGYKISALEIEEELRQHSGVADCAVVGIPSEEWGELVVAAIVPSATSCDTGEVNAWLRLRMASYKTPRRYLVVDALPRNAMGKVTKNDVKKLFEL